MNCTSARGLKQMGRKSAAKAKSAQTTPPADTPSPRRSFTPLLAVAIVLVVAAGGWYVLGSGSEQPAQTNAPAPTPSPAPPDSTAAAPNAKFGPRKQAALPPMNWGATPPVRQHEVVRAVYEFAAEHPEILGYVPCYCGCERAGHRGNDDCFVASRAANGDVTGWEPHGAT